MRIDQVDVVAAFKVDQSAPLKLGSALANVAEANKVPVTPLAVPSAAPSNIPRFMVGVQQSVLQAALDRVQLRITPPDHIRESAGEVFKFTRNEVSRLLEPLINESWMADQWAGVIVRVVFPIKDATALEAAGTAASAITNLNWPVDDLKAFQLQIGRQVNGFFRTFTVSGYELRTAKIDHLDLKPGQESVINFDELESVLDEAGIGVTLDVNNKAAPDIPVNRVGVGMVIDEVERALGSLRADLNLDGVLP